MAAASLPVPLDLTLAQDQAQAQAQNQDQDQDLGLSDLVDFVQALATPSVEASNDGRFAAEFYHFRQPERTFAFDGLAAPVTIEQRYLRVPDTGGAAYDAAVVLARALCHADRLVDGRTSGNGSEKPAPGMDAADGVRGRRVLEIGCGTGLTSIVAAHLGAAYVAATDGDKASVQLTAANLARNGLVLDPEPHRWWDAAAVARTAAQRFVWGRYDTDPFARQLEAEPGWFDLVLAADLVHDHSLYPLLCTTFGALLPAHHVSGRILMCYPTRCRPAEAAFLKSLEAAGMIVETLDARAWQTPDMSLPINLVRIRRAPISLTR